MYGLGPLSKIPRATLQHSLLPEISVVDPAVEK